MKRKQKNLDKKEAFWEKVTTNDLTSDGLVLNPDEFYILASREFVVIPETHAAEMRAYDTRVGEFRAHYAGFFDPGFGMASLGASPTRAVLEVRSHEVPFLIASSCCLISALSSSGFAYHSFMKVICSSLHKSSLSGYVHDGPKFSSANSFNAS